MTLAIFITAFLAIAVCIGGPWLALRHRRARRRRSDLPKIIL